MNPLQNGSIPLLNLAQQLKFPRWTHASTAFCCTDFKLLRAENWTRAWTRASIANFCSAKQTSERCVLDAGLDARPRRVQGLFCLPTSVCKSFSEMLPCSAFLHIFLPTKRLTKRGTGSNDNNKHSNAIKGQIKHKSFQLCTR